MTTNATYLYLVRHGATDNNLAHPPRLQGRRVDVPLSVTGRRQAECTAALWARGIKRARTAADELAGLRPIDAVYASPLLRARQTAEAIAQPLGLPVQTVEALIECDVGQWEGRSWPDIEREEPEEYRRFMANAYEHGYRGGENLSQVEQRVMPAFAELAAANAGRTIVVVAHNVVNRVYLGRLLEVPPAKRRGVPQENCGVNLLRFDAGQPKLLMLNSVFHLAGLRP